MRKRHSFGKISIATLLVLVVAVGGAWAYKHHQDQTAEAAQNQPSLGSSPATKADQSQSESVKNNAPTPSSANSPTVSSNSPTNRKSVVVNITSWGPDGNDFSVSGFVEGVIETDGTCTLTMTRGSTTVTAHNPAFANASDTSCGASIPSSKLAKGEWTARLSYLSASSSGTTRQDVTVK